MQARLLRVVQDREVVRVGGVHPIPVEFRLVAATLRELPRMVEQGSFRRDLYHRLRVLPIVTPALRERGEDDIVRLIRHFVRRHAQTHGRPVRALSNAAVERLLGHSWPGNVRELANLLEGAILLGEGPVLGADDLDLAGLSDSPSRTAPHPFEQLPTEARLLTDYTDWLLKRFGGSRSAVARTLGVARSTVNRRLRRGSDDSGVFDARDGERS